MRHPSRLLSLLLHRVLMAPAESGGGGGGGASGAGEDDKRDEDDGQGSDDDDGTGDGDDQGDDDAGSASSDGDEGDAADDNGDESDDDEISLTFGDDETPPDDDPARAPGWLRELRKSNREKDRRIRELEGQVAAAKPAPAKIEVGPEPDPKDYEMWEPEQAAKFKADLLGWTQRKAAAEAEQRQQQEAQETAQREWNARLKAVDDAGAALKVKDHTEAVEALADTFSVAQMGMLIDAASDAKQAAKLRYALGKHPAKAKELAGIKHPVKFIAAVVRLEGQLKEKPRTAPPTPESQVRPSGAGRASAVDNQNERAREDARKSGDYSKVLELRRQQQARAKKRA